MSSAKSFKDVYTDKQCKIQKSKYGCTYINAYVCTMVLRLAKTNMSIKIEHVKGSSRKPKLCGKSSKFTRP
jgi:hypothetical protein